MLSDNIRGSDTYWQAVCTLELGEMRQGDFRHRWDGRWAEVPQL